MAGLFGMFDPTREGKGVSKNEKKKRRFFVFFEIYFRKFSKILFLNIIYTLICLPIVTIGPATAALTYCMRNFAREDYADISDFFIQFKKNFWQGLLVWFAFTIAFAVAVFGLIFYNALMKSNNIFGYFGFVIAIIAIIILLFMSYYAYMIIVTFKVNFRQLVKDCFLFAIAGLGSNIITTLILGIIGGFLLIFGVLPIVGPLFNPEIPASLDAVCLTGAMYLFFIPSLVSFIINFNVYPCVKRFMLDPALEQQAAEEQIESIFEDVD